MADGGRDGCGRDDGGHDEWRLPVADAATVRRATWRLIREDGRSMAAVVVLTCLAALVALAPPWIVGEIVDVVEAGDATMSTVNVLALVLLGFAVAQLVLTRCARYAVHRFGERALARLREEFVGGVLALPTRVAERAGTGDLVTRSTGDVGVVGLTLRNAAPDVFLACVQAAFVFGAIFLLHPLLGACALVGLPLMVWVFRWYLKRAREAYLAEGQANSDVTESMMSTAEGARTVEAFGLRDVRVAEADAAIGRAYRTRVRTLALRSVFFPVSDVANVLPAAVLLVLGGFAYTEGIVSLGAVVAGSLYIWQLTEPIARLHLWLEQLQRSGASFARIKGIEHVAGRPGPVELRSASADADGTAQVPADDRIELIGVRFAYVDGHDVLHGIDLTVEPGEKLAIVGPSGAGKTTLGRLLAGVDVPRAGRVLVGGVPVAHLPPDRREIVLVTQEHHVFMASLRDNVAMAVPGVDDDRLRAALDTVDATWARSLPDGLDTMVGAGGLPLDAAQAQQLALARVLVHDPHTLILDEATSLLDPTTARHAERSLAAVLEGRTVITIAHRLHSAHDADRVAVVEDGRLTELGAHDDLVTADGSYAALWRSWHGGVFRP
ncbi:ABC transporter ATP-binding protein [Phytoactinopolyspora halotolerans]